jgi:hypothetical protein
VTVLLLLGAVVAVCAGIRSTWSPCGQSMLSSITPLSERSRGHRFGVTAAWFVAGSLLGGATLGLGLAAVAAAVGLVGPLPVGTALAIAAVAAAVAAASDARVLGRSLPYHCRQVNELWLNRYRRWVYAAGFGWQIGTGFATFVLTAGVYLLVVVAALTADPAAAFALGTGFGLVRGLGILPARRITSPTALAAFHQRFDAWGPVTRVAMTGVESGVAVVAAAAALGAPGGVLGVVAATAILVTVLAARRRHAARPEGTPVVAAPAR